MYPSIKLGVAMKWALLAAVSAPVSAMAAPVDVGGGGGVSADDVRHMLTTQYQFRPSAASILGGFGDDATTTDPTALLTSAVSAGNWKQVATVLGELPPGQASAVYHRIISSVNDSAASISAADRDALRPDDVIGLADALATTAAMLPTDVATTGRLFGSSLALAGPSTDVLAELKSGTGRFGSGTPAQRSETANMLIAANELDWAKNYLPTPDAVLAANDPATDSLFYRYAIPAAQQAEKNGDETAAARLRYVAFQILLRNMLRPGGVNPNSVATTFDLAYKLNQTQLVLDALRPLVKANAPELRTLLAAAAAMPPQAAGAENMTARANALQVQSDLANFIVDDLPADPSVDDARLIALNAYAANWVNEAAFAVAHWKTTVRPFDPQPRMQFTRQSTAIKEMTPELLWARAPRSAWLAQIHDPLRTMVDRKRFDIAMNLDDTDDAMAILAEIAKAYPNSDDIAAEGLSLWAKLHQTARVMPMMISGMQPPLGIPLTKVAQDRNIDNLVSLLGRLKTIYGRPFTQHYVPVLYDTLCSQAEVYSVADMQRVFGPLDQLETPVLIQLCDQMRSNLENVWDFNPVQAASDTGRDETQAVNATLDGYVTLENLLSARARQTNDPALYHRVSEAEFRHADVVMAANNDFGSYTHLRAAGFDNMRQALALDAAQPGYVTSPKTYVSWFSLALGSEELNKVTSKSLFDVNELAKLKTTLDSQPPPQAAACRAALLAAVNSTVDQLQPDVRYRIIQAALQVAGDDVNARGLKSAVHYYDDLLSEVKFVARLDGPPKVGSAPFGVEFVLQHTDNLERQTRGFSKYVQNQFLNRALNPGKPGATTNYRNDLEKHIRTSLSPAYDIQSIVRSADDVASYAGERAGWRETPLCYVVAKAKDATVDRIPSVQIDLDFIDRVSAVVLPIASGVVIVNSATAEPRPVSNLTVDETLNDHDAKVGKLELTVTASGEGLMPTLDQLVALDSLKDLRATEVKDSGVQPDQFEVPSTADKNAAVLPLIASHRKWTVTLASSGETALASTFRFPKLVSTAPPATVRTRRFSDADIVDCGPEVAVIGLGDQPRTRGLLGGLVGAVVIGCIAAALFILRRRRTPAVDIFQARRSVDLTPFAVLGRLQKLDRTPDRMNAETRERLIVDIQLLERHYFRDGKPASVEPDLATISDRWN